MAVTSEHACDHCADGDPGHGRDETSGHDAPGHVDAPDPTATPRERLALARRRLAPRLILGVLGLGAAVVLAQQADVDLVRAVAGFAASAVVWAAAAWGGVVLGALLATGRGPTARLALGQVVAAGLAILGGLGVALTLIRPSAPADASTSTDWLPVLATGLVAAASGWFFAGAVAEAVRLRSLGAALDRQDETGAVARAQAELLTLPAIQRAELTALAIALGFGLAVAGMTAVPVIAVVAIPLAAAGAAWWGLRASRADRTD